ncbi:MAG: DUF6713 family protein [Pseudomonadota bacterium]
MEINEGVLDGVYAGLLGLFFTHEIDAALRREWRLLPVLRDMDEPRAQALFIWAHPPLFALILWGGADASINATRLGVAAFAVIHVGLHAALRSHPAYAFNGLGSRLLIGLTGVFGALYLVLAAAA